MKTAVILLVGLCAGVAARTQPSAVDAARVKIEALIAKSGGDAAVAWRPLDAKPGEQIFINETTRFHAASTMKVPVMIELFKQAAAGRLSLDDSMTVTNHFTSIIDGSDYELASTEDSDGEVYKSIGKPMTYRALCEAMITVSSNLAADNLIQKLNPKTIQATTDAMGASGMQLLRGVEDQKAFDAGKNNETDAMGLFTLLDAIGNGKAVSKDASAGMIEILKRQSFNAGIPAGLPPGTPVAHKTGSITKIHHDAGIVYAARPYVLVILTRGFEKESDSDALIAAITRLVSAVH